MSDLTSGLNRRGMFLEKVEHVLRTDTQAVRALLIVNVRHLREINIALGSARTDRLLTHLAGHFSRQMRADDPVAHLGADEFGILLTRLPNPDVATLAAAKLHASVKPAVDFDGQEIPVRLNIGIALCTDADNNSEEVLRRACIAVAEARRSEREDVVYNDALKSASQDGLDLRRELRMAIESGELQLHYQPKVRLASGEVSGAEALMRWQSPLRGRVPPDVFIPIAEQSELIEPLSFWSLNAALRQCSICRTRFDCLSVAVNLSARILHHPHLVDVLTRAMNIWGTQPGKLILEVTESAMMRDPTASLRTLQTLHDAGITISIDDFGTGYSSLAYLKRLPIRELKIDKSFVLNMHNDRDDESIVRAIVDLSHNLGVTVVAEGIETQDAFDKLNAMGCDYGQGYFIARPMAAEAMIEWMNSSTWSTARTCAL
jgi:diguanylate cyclase